MHSTPSVPSIKTDEPRPPTRKNVQSLSDSGYFRTKPTTRLKLGDLLNADVKVKTEPSGPPITLSASKRSVKPQITGGYLTASNIDDLNRIWTADPRVPTIESRKAWAVAQGIAKDRVSAWFNRKRSRALRIGAALGEGTYELSVDAPGPKAIVVKQEAIVGESVLEEKTAFGRSKTLVKLETVLKSAVKEEFNDPPALRTRSKRQVHVADTRLSSTHPTLPPIANPSVTASTRSADFSPTRRKRKQEPTNISGVAESSPLQMLVKRRKTCASKPISTRAKPQVVAKQATPKIASSKVIPNIDHPRPVRKTQKIHSASSQKFPAPADDASVAQPLAAPGTKHSSLISAEERTAVDLLPDSLNGKTKTTKTGPGAESSGAPS